jgi:hypothetical protein
MDLTNPAARGGPFCISETLLRYALRLPEFFLADVRPTLYSYTYKEEENDCDY